MLEDDNVCAPILGHIVVAHEAVTQTQNLADCPLHEIESQNVVDAPADVKRSEAVYVEGASADLNVNSIVKEIVAILEVLGEGRPHVESTVVVVGEESIAASPSYEAEVVI